MNLPLFENGLVASLPRSLFQVDPIRVSDADGSIVQTIRQWIPQAFLGTPIPQLLVCRHSESGQPVGAASVRRFPGNRTARLLLFVATKSRRHGCGTQLLDAAIQAARAVEAENLLTGLPVSSEHAGFFQTAGMTVDHERKRYRIDLNRLAERLDPLYRRWLARGGLPDGYQLVSLRESPSGAVAAFCARHVGGFAGNLQSLIDDRATGFDAGISPVLIRDGQIVGALLATKNAHDRSIFVHTTSVVQDVRGRWPSMVLRLFTTTNSLKAGLRAAVFDVDLDRHVDTWRFAEGCGGTVVKHGFYFARSI